MKASKPMKEHRTAPSPVSRLVKVGIWIAGAASFGGLIAMLLLAIEKVRVGQGLDTYRTHWMVEFNWIGFLLFLAATVLALGVGLLLRLKERREIQQLQKKYSHENHD